MGGGRSALGLAPALRLRLGRGRRRGRLAAEADLPGERLPLRRVVRRHHRVVRLEAPARAVLSGVMPWSVIRCRFSIFSFLPSSRQTMWSSVTERRIGTAGVSSTGAAGSSDASPRSVSKTDWISAADVGARDGVVADMRRHDLGGEGEKLASIDGLVFGHACPLLGRSAHPEAAKWSAHPQLRMLCEQYWSASPRQAGPDAADQRAPLAAGGALKAQSRSIVFAVARTPAVLVDRAQAPPLARCTSLLDWPAAPCSGPFFSPPRRRHAEPAQSHREARSTGGPFSCPRRHA